MPGYHLPYFTADAMGIFRDHGLEVEIVHPEPGPENIEAVAAGRYDFCLTSVTHFLRATTGDPGIGARFVFMVARHTHMGVFYAQDRPASHGRLIQTFSDLEGASFIGNSDSPFAREYLQLLKTIGVTAAPLVEMPYGEVAEGLAMGKGDVTADYVDLGPDYQARGMANGDEITALPFHEAGIDTYGSGLVAGTRLIESRPDLVRAVIAVVQEALEATRHDPSRGVGALLEAYPEAGFDRTLASWKASEPLIFLDDGRAAGEIDPDKWRRTAAHHMDVHATTFVEPESVYVACG
ncbi:MAG: ABC transporter substrate-binding protein [Actinobacteria bacterium]|nr:ABC transporter substrate-binding protein [Actinomycetota bacterium]